LLVDLFQYQPEFVNRFVRLVELSTRCPSDEMLGRNCRFLQGAGSSSAAVAATRLAVAERRGMSIEILGYRQDAGPFWNSLHISPIEHDAGEITTSSLQDRRQRIQKGAVPRSVGAPSAVGGRPSFENDLAVVDSVVRLAGRLTGRDRLPCPANGARIVYPTWPSRYDLLALGNDALDGYAGLATRVFSDDFEDRFMALEPACISSRCCRNPALPASDWAARLIRPAFRICLSAK
jgi:hypothetical protein